MKTSGRLFGGTFRPLLALSALLGVLQFSKPTLHAGTLTVTNLADSGPGTLREAISLAQPGDDIGFAVRGTIFLSTGALQINNNVQILGPGTGQLIVDAQRLSSVFVVSGKAIVGISDLTITNGSALYGGGILSFHGNVALTNCVITHCYAYWFGGGIYSSGPLRMERCSISHNRVDDGTGGGIFAAGFQGAEIEVVINECAVTENTASGLGDPLVPGRGGGIHFDLGILRVANSTVSGNVALSANSGMGAGINTYPYGPTSQSLVQLENCTVVSNIVGNKFNLSIGAPPSALVGAGIASANFEARNTIVSGNFSALVTSNSLSQLVSANCFGAMHSLGYNLIKDTNGCTVLGDTASNIYGEDPVLGPLGNNGGFTLTHALLPGSPAIDAGSPTNFPAVDQRGFPRPQDGIGDGTVVPDIGAYESHGPRSVTLFVTSLADSGPGTLREAISLAQSGDLIKIVVQGELVLSNGTLAGDLVIDKDLQIIGPGNANFRITEYGNSPVFIVNSNVTATISRVSLSGKRAGCIWNFGNLTVKACVLADSYGDIWSGGIYNSGNLIVSSSTITNCSSYFGGGILSFAGGIVKITNSVITQCSVFRSGGGVLSSGPLTMVECSVHKNFAGTGEGGGLWIFGAPAIIDKCAVTENTASGDPMIPGLGGGIYYRGEENVLRITNSTISGNMTLSRTEGAGAGIHADSAQLESCTIVSNIVKNQIGFVPDDLPPPVVGAGIFADVFEARNCIIALNFSALFGASVLPPPVESDAAGTLVSGGYNLIKTVTGLIITGDQTGNIFGVDPLIGPLQDNGGPTLTHALLDGSPAINAGSPFIFPPVDQRGFIRPAGGTGDSVFLPDIGAFEKQPSTAVVTTLADSGPGSLRDALGTAAPGARISFAVPGTIFLTSGPLIIDRNIELIGPCEQRLTIDARGSSVGVVVASGVEASISGVTISNAINSARPPEGNGGGIRNLGSLILTRVAVLRNSATGLGGGIYNGGKLTLRQCLVSSNSATFGGGIGDDGFNRLTVDSSTISFNNAISPDETSGGGIYKLHDVALLTDSTISKNGADEGNGGGIATFCYMRFESCTIASNRAFAIRLPLFGKGGGIYVGAGGSVDLHNTILAGNSATGGGPDCFGTLVSQGYNLIQNTSGCTIAGVLVGNRIGVDPKLGPLNHNGGPTPTHALLASSPAIDAGSPYDFPPTDQRGVARPQDGNGDGVAITDIGAYERETVIPGTIPGNLVVTSLADSGPGTLREALGRASSGSKITFDVQGTIVVLNSPLPINNNVQIAGPGGDKLALTGNSPIFVVSNGATARISDLTITNVSGVGPGGGAIRNFGKLTLTRCVISHCRLEGGTGGAIYSAGDLALHECSLSNNVTGFGGAVADVGNGRLIVDRTTVNNNLASYGGTSGALGGGILKLSGLMWISNSTVSANEVRTGDGGGLATGSSYVFIDGCTIVSNKASSSLAEFGRGGGIYKLDNGTIRIKNTILAGNSAMTEGIGSFGPDCFGWLFSEGWNLIQNTSNCVLAGVLTGNIIGADPRLGPLAENGGPTLTHAVLNGSPAIDAGSPYSFQPIDQRGVSRPQDGNGDGIAVADIGAYEKETPMPPCIAMVESITVQNDVCIVASGAPGERYTVQYTESLSSPQWVTLPAVAASQTGLLKFIERRDQSKQSGFYRVIRVSNP